jgi:protease-4
MANRHPIIRGLGLLTGFVLVVFAAAFFYAYFTGGDAKALSLLAGDGIGILQVEGTINDSRDVLTELRRFREAPWIKAIVLRIDSPGGAVAPTQEIFDELQKVRIKKPLIASMGGMATSGGYYIASACEKIVANPGTMTGSIGVIMQLNNVEELMKKIGVKGQNIKSGANKDIGSPFKALSPEGRGMDEAVVKKLADGRVYSGAQAKDLGLVDELGNLEYAVDLAAKRVGLEESPVLYYSRLEQERWWGRLFFSLTGIQWSGSDRPGLRYEWSLSLLR